MNERRRPFRRGRGPRPLGPRANEPYGDADPYREPMEPPVPGTDNFDAPAPRTDANGATSDDSSNFGAPVDTGPAPSETAEPTSPPPYGNQPGQSPQPNPPGQPNQQTQSSQPHNQPQQPFAGGGQGGRPHNDRDTRNNGRRNQRNPRGRGRNRPQQQQQQRDQAPRQPMAPIVPDGETTGWYDPQRDGGFIRRAANSYLTDPGDAYVPPNLARQYGLRRGDAIFATTGRDHRGRVVVAEITQVNADDPALAARRPDFGSLTASYPERKLTLETGRPAKGGPELTRRAIDLIAPIGYGQRALIVAPARAGKTMLLQAIVEGVAINHPQATLLVLL